MRRAGFHAEAAVEAPYRLIEGLPVSISEGHLIKMFFSLIRIDDRHLLLGGIEMALAYAIAGLLAFLLIVTAPLGVAAFRLAGYTLWPFGRSLVEKPTAGAGSALGNVVWTLVFGWILALGHLLAAFVNAVTVICIPFAVAHLKLARTALVPFGHEVVDSASGSVVVRPLGS